MMHGGLVIAVASAMMNFGTIYERDGIVAHRFVLHNENAVAVNICQTFPSCGCTTIACDKQLVPPHDSVAVDVSFNPAHRGGEFYETASVVMASAKDTAVVTLSVEGTVVTSEETLMRQYPIRVGHLRLTADTLRMGEVRRGESKTMYVGVLHDLSTGRHTSVPITFKADSTVGWGLVERKMAVAVDDSATHQVNVTVTAVVLPRFSDDAASGDGAQQPRIDCTRCISRSEGSLEIANSGNATLTVYRAYTDDGVDLLPAGPFAIPPSGSRRVSLKRLKSGSRRITLITNDRRRSRFVVTVAP